MTISPADPKVKFFIDVSSGNVAEVAATLKENPGAVDWRYTLNGLNQPVTMIAYDPAILKLLLEHKADPNAADRTGNTPLIESGDGVDRINLLLDFGAEIDKANNNGLTPLMRAAFNSATKVVHTLLERGANPDLTDKDGQTAEQIARARFYPDLADTIHGYAEAKQRRELSADIEHFHSGLDHEVKTARRITLRGKPPVSFTRFSPVSRA